MCVCVRCCRYNLVTITELLESIRKLQNISDSRKYEMIAQVLDEDRDGVIDKADVMQVIHMYCVALVQIYSKLHYCGPRYNRHSVYTDFFLTVYTDFFLTRLSPY